MAVSESRHKANEKYNRNNYDTTIVRFRKDKEPTLASVRNAAQAAGMSLNQFIIEAVTDKMSEKRGD